MSLSQLPLGPSQPQIPAAYYPPPANYGSGLPHHHHGPMVLPSQKPKVGLAVVCRCAPGNSNVQCLLQKRGQHSSSPNKWSFPGGRLEQPGDLDENGSVGTKRELNEECGGGSPQGLPPLIHIECNKSGKSQTMYHVFVVDMSINKEWELWQPKYRNGKGGSELDTMVGTLSLQGKCFSCNHGYCWVDMSVLIRECYELNPNELANSDLQYGLVRWVQNYGEHILKTLIARSPKLPHPRRLGNQPAMTPPSDGPMMIGGMRPRASRQDSGGKPRRFDGMGGAARTVMLHPSYQTGGPPFVQPGGIHMGMAGSPTNTYYNMLPLNPSQLSPPMGGANAATTPTNGGGGGGGSYMGSLVIQMPPGIIQGTPQNAAGMVGQGGLMIRPPVLPPGDSPAHPPVGVTQPSSPVLHSQICKPEGGSGGMEQNSFQPSQTQSLMSSHAPLMATSSLPITRSPGQHLTSPPNSGNGSGGGLPVRSSFEAVVPPPLSAAGHSLPVSTNHQFLQPLPPPNSSNTPLPQLSHSLPAPPLPPAVTHPLPSHLPPMAGGDSEPLLPNPPLPSSASLLPLVPSMTGVPPAQVVPPPPQHFQQHQLPGLLPGTLRTPLQQSLLPNQVPPMQRKEVVCRHYLRGVCPYDEKCWFAHPEPPGPSSRGEIQGSAMPSPVQIPPQYWVGGNPVMDYMAFHSSPQSPLTPPFVPRPGMVPNLMFRPRGGVPYSNQQPYMYYRGSSVGASRNASSNFPLLQTNNPIPMQVNPVLKFGLISRVNPAPVEGEGPAQVVSQLESYADHFFVSHASDLTMYRIIFGGNRTTEETAVPMERRKLERVLTYVYCSTLQPMVLLLGTDTGDVSFMDLRKGSSHGTVSPVYSTEVSSEPISALTHFSTSFNSAQVVVAGNEGGVVTWYISQPPQKTFSLLYANREAHASSKIVALQMLGGFLVSADSAGTVVIWSMMSHSPAILSTFTAHSISLTNLHVVDASHFITIGMEMAADPAQTEPTSNGTVDQDTAPSPAANPNSVTLIPSASENLESKMAALDVNSSTIELEAGSPAAAAPPLLHSPVSSPTQPPSSSPTQFKVKLWEFDKPPKMVKEIPDMGTVVCSSFHCHNPPGNMFLGLGMKHGSVRVYNVPDFTLATEIHFEEMPNADCVQLRLNLSRETPIFTHAYYRNPFRDLILTSAWSNGKIVVCQVAKQ